jgi:Niemann-Pick C1 protein
MSCSFWLTFSPSAHSSAGTPLTSMTQILPFVLFGVGLDDAFIICGGYDRTDPTKEPEDRIHATIKDIGISITISTITTTLAFGIGCISSIPVIYWLCLYAFPTILLVYFYQVTFFIAWIVLDDRRIKQRHRDCCWCISVGETSEVSEPQDQEESRRDPKDQTSVTERFMLKYAEYLLRPWVKLTVVLAFTALLCAGAISASNLTQSFSFTDVLPNDSYLTDFFDALDDYTDRSSISPLIYFRNVDQSDKNIQEQMESYINDLVFMVDAILEPPGFFWLRDFKVYVNNSEDSLAQLDFNDQVQAFLNDPVYSELYRDDIVTDSDGTIITSRCRIDMDNIDLQDIKQQIDALEAQRTVTKAQPSNQGQKDWSFFTFEGIYNIWEFYAVSVDELIITTVTGVAAVTGVAFLLIPHLSAALFVLPLISIMYIDVLGVLQWAGAHVNPVSYIAMVMSIGLLVDYAMHVLLRYYESPGNRKEKTVEMLRTMGASILIAGISTFLGTLPLAFSTSEIFTTVFYAFLGLVTVGCGHGLILLPVVLSIIGPEDPTEEQVTGNNSRVHDSETSSDEKA